MGEKSQGNWQNNFGVRKKAVIINGKVRNVPWGWEHGDPLPKEEKNEKN